MSVRLFGTDGMRGRVNKYPMTPEVALRLGLAAGTFYRDKNRRSRVVIGKDTRLSGYVFENRAGGRAVLAAGMDVFLVGPLPTPAIAFLTTNMRADVGVVISASHNPFSDNGIKFFDAEGFKIPDADRRSHDGNGAGPEFRLELSRTREHRPCLQNQGRSGPLHRVSQKQLSPRTCPLKGCGWSLTAPMAPTIGSRRWPLRSWAPKSSAWGPRPTGLNINRRLRFAPPRGHGRPGYAKPGPISALPWTATPTA